MEAGAIVGKCYVTVHDAITGDSNEQRMERMESYANDLRVKLGTLEARQKKLLHIVKDSKMTSVSLNRIENELRRNVEESNLVHHQIEEIETEISDLKGSMIVADHIDRRHDFSKDARMCVLSSPVSIAKRKTEEIKAAKRVVATHKKEYSKLSRSKGVPIRSSSSLAALAAGAHDRPAHQRFKSAPDPPSRIAAYAQV